MLSVVKCIVSKYMYCKVVYNTCLIKIVQKNVNISTVPILHANALPFLSNFFFWSLSPSYSLRSLEIENNRKKMTF